MAIVNTGGNDVQLKTINNESLKGTGNITIDEVPSTTGASIGDILTLDSSLAPIWAAAASGGGNVTIEKLNPANLPTDFVDTDILLVGVGVELNFNYFPSSWTSTFPSNATIYVQGASHSTKNMIICTQNESSYNPEAIIQIGGGSAYIYGARLSGVSGTYGSSVAKWNENGSLINVYPFGFNGSSCKSGTTLNITRANAGTYLRYVFRIRFS